MKLTLEFNRVKIPSNLNPWYRAFLEDVDIVIDDELPDDTIELWQNNLEHVATMNAREFMEVC